MLTYEIIETVNPTTFKLNISRGGEVIATNCTFATRSQEAGEATGRSWGEVSLQEMVEEFVLDQGL